MRRLVEQRGLTEEDARHRIAAQATDAQRRAVADVVLDNAGTPDEPRACRRRVCGRSGWQPYAVNLASGTRSRRPDRAADAVVAPRADWEPRAERVVARLAAALAATGVVTEVSHIGSTSVPGLIAKDVIDVQVGVHHLADADRDDVRAAFADAGYVFNHGIHSDTPHPGGADPADWLKRFLGGCDPGNHVHVHVREKGSAGWRFALLFRDWLRHEPAERDVYAAEKRRLLALHESTSDYVVAKEPWFEGAWQRANGLGRAHGVAAALGSTRHTHAVRGVVAGMRGEYKVPGGKLVAVDLEEVDGRLAGVSVSGDFFLEPDEALGDINAALTGMPVDAGVEQLAGAVTGALADDVSLIGFTAESIGIAIRRALGKATGWDDHALRRHPGPRARPGPARRARRGHRPRGRRGERPPDAALLGLGQPARRHRLVPVRPQRGRPRGRRNGTASTSCGGSPGGARCSWSRATPSRTRSSCRPRSSRA